MHANADCTSRQLSFEVTIVCMPTLTADVSIAAQYRQTTLLRVFNDLLTSSDSNQISISTLLDLSAAFDRIDYDVQLNPSSNVFGIHDTALAFFESCLELGKAKMS